MLKPVPAHEPETPPQRAVRLGEEAEHAQGLALGDLLQRAHDLAAECAVVDLLDRTHPGVRGEVVWIGREIERRLLVIASIKANQR